MFHMHFVRMTLAICYNMTGCILVKYIGQLHIRWVRCVIVSVRLVPLSNTSFPDSLCWFVLDPVTLNKVYLSLPYCKFVYGLFNNVVGSFAYMALNRGMLYEELMGNAVEGRCNDIICGSVFISPEGAEEFHEKNTE